MRLKKLSFFLIFMLVTVCSFGGKLKDTEDFKLIVSPNVLKEDTRCLDINTATLQKLKSAKINASQAKSIIKYRDITGGFEDIRELKRIKGIGPVTFDKLKDKLTVKTKIKRKPLYINEADAETLKLFGFDKKQVKKIMKYKKTHGKIRNNLELQKILPKKSYEKYKKIIKYNKF